MSREYKCQMSIVLFVVVGIFICTRVSNKLCCTQNRVNMQKYNVELDDNDNN